MVIIGQMGSVRVVYPLAVIACLVIDRAAGLRVALALAAVLFLEIFAAGVAKDIVLRPRPQDAALSTVLGRETTVRRLYLSVDFPFVSPVPSRLAGQAELGLGVPRGESFPSGHAVVAFAVAYVLGRRFVAARSWLYLLAGLAGISRIYVGAHYPLDVIAGALLGVWGAKGMLALWVFGTCRPGMGRGA
ncbi:putative phosphoesterase, PAP2 family [Candidatus Terasakiella magnetica]|nr:putative phosphoesterase, PAP2 family [Candidatus Terasakiella magnetica]